jgi:hypothetical protein
VIGDFDSSVTDRYVSFSQKGDRVSDPSFIVPLTKRSGMSGGALLAPIGTRGPILSGIIYQAHSGSTDIIYASHAEFINVDGTIAR